MKYYLYIYKLPFAAAQFNVANHYMVAQSEGQHNSDSKTIEVIEERLEPVTVDGHADFDVHTHKIVHVDRAVPKALKVFLPAAAYTFVERSDSHWPMISTVYECPGRPDKFSFGVYTATHDRGEMTGPPECFRQFMQRPGKLVIFGYDFASELKQMNNPDLAKTCSYSYKLMVVDVQLTGFQTIIENFAGSKMKAIFTANYKNLVLDYQTWSKFSAEDIPRLRTGQGVAAPQVIQKLETEVEIEK